MLSSTWLAIALSAIGAATGWWLLAPWGVWALNRRREDAHVLLTRGQRVSITLLAAALFGAAAWRVGLDPLLPAVIVFASASAILIVTDAVHHRLPNAVVLPTVGAVVVLVLGGSLLRGDWLLAISALLGGAALFTLFLLLALFSPSAMGMGDVKLAGLLGVMLGLTGWFGWLLGLAAMFVVGGVVAAIALLTRRAGPGTAIAFGPSMIVGVLLVLGVAWPH